MSRDELGARDGLELFMETENKHKEFHQDGIGWSG
jgi:hypothetical protein